MLSSKSAELANPGQDAGWELLQWSYAHRGLWSEGGPPENSLAAFRAAAEAGLAAECDVRLTQDGELVVFHDARVDRMTAAEGEVRRLTAADCTALRLRGSEERVPTLAALLDIWPSELPLLIEVKADDAADATPLADALADALRGRPAAQLGVMSFSEAFMGQMRWPVRGQLARWGHDEFTELAQRSKKMSCSFIGAHREDAVQAHTAARAAGLDLLLYTIATGADLIRSRAEAPGAALVFEHIGVPAPAAPRPLA